MIDSEGEETFLGLCHRRFPVETCAVDPLTMHLYGSVAQEVCGTGILSAGRAVVEAFAIVADVGAGRGPDHSRDDSLAT